MAVLAVSGLTGSLVATSAGAASAATVGSATFSPKADTYVDSTAPSTNYNSSAILRVTARPSITRVPYLKFAVAGIPDGATNIKAVLSVRATESASFSVRAHKTSAFDATKLTWRIRPSVGAVLSDAGKPVSGRDLTFDVSKAVTGNGTVNVALTASDSTASSTWFPSREDATSSKRPRLSVSWTAPAPTPTPTPTTTAPAPAPTTTAPAPAPTTTAPAPAPTTTAPAPAPTTTAPAPAPTTTAPAPAPTTTAPAPAPTTTAPAPAPTTTAPAPATYPAVASVQQRDGESWADACVRTMSYGFTGCVRYLPAGKLPAWDTAFKDLAAKVGDKPVSIQLTAKSHDNAGLEQVITNLPASWKPLFIYNIYQEPEDNLLDAASQAAYRNAYTQAATVTRKHGVSLPWVEWQQWTVDPVNSKGWDLRNFTPPASDFGGVLWSFYEYNEKDRIVEQVAQVKAAMNTYAPGKPWGLMAAGYTLEGTVTDAKLQAQAAWMAKSHSLTRQGGSTTYAWFNWDWPGTGGAAGEARVELNPYAMKWLSTRS